MRATRNSIKEKGFTVIELMVVIAVFGILLALAVNMRLTSNQKARNLERQRDITELRNQFEAYHALYSRYPTLSEVNNPTWRTTHMKSIDGETFRDPLGKSFDLTQNPEQNIYSYIASNGKSKTCDNKKIICTHYTLTATLEGSNVFIKQNLN